MPPRDTVDAIKGRQDEELSKTYFHLELH